MLADLAVAGALSRQAAYIVAVDANIDEPASFLGCLGIKTAGAAGVGEALRTRQARDLIAATYGVVPDAVPTGYLRALLRIEEAGADRPGLDAFANPESYRRLFGILSNERHSRRANALRYCGRLRSGHVHAAEHLAPALVYPEIVAIMGTAAQVDRANALLDLLRRTVSTVTEEEIARALRDSLKGGSILERFARKILERADRLPDPPLPASENLRPLRSAAEIAEFGRRMGNCAGTKVAEIVLGMLYLYEVEHVLEDGSVVPLALSLTPLTNGLWMVADVTMRRNRRPPAHVLRAVLERLQNLGAVVAGPTLKAAYRQDLARLLGAHRWAAIDECLRLDVDTEDELDAVEALAAEIGEAA
ncbi:hypothetical protein [Methylobacterium sp. J-070]|uniref:hypothetical protein n=1 Tax=Methylobacterium sp. J-070 TaxID=2836650 RepID=UPI001FB98CA4|nr:hypothetical protein [Methylobacterium sp. J-070]MCJ2052810.1 hypothetical protein [Methylobacterium sp. J-070]